MVTFKEFYELLTEVKDSTRNQQELIRVYGLDTSNGKPLSPDNASMRAKDLIRQWNDVEPNIDPKHDYFGSPNNKTYNPRDIFSWGRVAKDMGWKHPEGFENLKAMMINLSRQKEQKVNMKTQQGDYDKLAETEHATLYRPKSMAASCKLGAGTKWCVSGKENNQFDSYMAQGVVLFYAITKSQKYNTAQAVWPPQPAGASPNLFPRAPGEDFKQEEKYAVAMYPDGETFEFFDAQDNKMGTDEWHELFQSLGLPTDPAFYKKHGPTTMSLLKQSVNNARNIISGATQRDPYGHDEDSDWELLMDVFKKVERVYRDKDQLTTMAKYREQENLPDEVFLMDVLDHSSLTYFTDREYNPAGSNDLTNSQFQQEIVRNIGRLTYLTNQSNSDGWKQEDIQDMDDMSHKVRGPGDGDEARNTFHQLRMYISRHLNDEWPALEEALIKHWSVNHDAVNIKVSGGYSEHTATPFDSTYMWLRMMMDIKNGEWPELEQMIHKRVKSVLHTGDKDPDFENRKDGIQSMGSNYNSAANFYRRVDNTDRRAWLPQSDEHFKRYMDGEWDIDGPPLTDIAMRERQYKNKS